MLNDSSDAMIFNFFQQIQLPNVLSRPQAKRKGIYGFVMLVFTDDAKCPHTKRIPGTKKNGQTK